MDAAAANAANAAHVPPPCAPTTSRFDGNTLPPLYAYQHVGGAESAAYGDGGGIGYASHPARDAYGRAVGDASSVMQPFG